MDSTFKSLTATYNCIEGDGDGQVNAEGDVSFKTVDNLQILSPGRSQRVRTRAT
jgi:hypothetical protein